MLISPANAGRNNTGGFYSGNLNTGFGSAITPAGVKNSGFGTTGLDSSGFFNSGGLDAGRITDRWRDADDADADGCRRRGRLDTRRHDGPGRRQPARDAEPA